MASTGDRESCGRRRRASRRAPKSSIQRRLNPSSPPGIEPLSPARRNCACSPPAGDATSSASRARRPTRRSPSGSAPPATIGEQIHLALFVEHLFWAAYGWKVRSGSARRRGPAGRTAAGNGGTVTFACSMGVRPVVVSRPFRRARSEPAARPLAGALPRLICYRASIVASEFLLPKGGAMSTISPAARQELVTAVAERYQRSTAAEKGWILDEFVALTGYHRKHAIRVLERKRGDARGAVRTPGACTTRR